MTSGTIHHSILENMREGVMSVDLKGTITTFNAAAQSILGLDRSDVLGRSLAEVFLVMDGSDDLIQTILDAVYESATTHHRRVWFPLHEKRRLLDITTSFLSEQDSESGDIHRVGVIAVFSDVTEVEKLRDKLRAMAALRVEQLVRAYRERGHVLASLDPLGRAAPGTHPELEPAHYDIGEKELDEIYTILWGNEPVERSLRAILDDLRHVYCGAVGIQYMHIDDLATQGWLRERLEAAEHRYPLPRNEQVRILRKLTDAEAFESFLQGTFKRAKRFSLEGAETLIPLLDQAIIKAGTDGVRDIVIGMSHRGRLNVICNVLGVPAAEIFRRFERFDSGDDEDSDGDVRFHLGVEGYRELTDGATVRLSLCFNPSHLEFVGPVVLGRSRARQDRISELCGHEKVLPLIVHGDAAFAGQGIVQEQFNLSRLDAYATGGTIHVILNNQIGFTTEPAQSRSTQYATDVARMLQIPIFHVNGEDPEAVDRVVRLAMDFRRTWHRDVVIDMYCFRRRGHMELDDPSFTQPLLYRDIATRAPVHQTYTQNLLRLGQVSDEEAEEIVHRSREELEKELSRAEKRDFVSTEDDPVGGLLQDSFSVPYTGVPVPRLVSLLESLCARPPEFELHTKVEAVLKRRLAMSTGRQRLDWASGEALAYASLVAEGRRVRLSGQDSERGTFGHRHAVLHDFLTGATHVPLAELADAGEGCFSIHNSPLTESAVLGFELGYSIEASTDLVIWEAQFGDFANVAQVMIDQFLVSSDAKWRQPSGLVLFLPHGLEGQGPEHSSARPERFLQLCARRNISLAYLTTASQVFHRLRLQVLSAERRPLIVFTPKRMLQHNSASSSLEDLADGRFREIIVDRITDAADQILICSGQLGVELAAERKKLNASSTIVRLEQVYPLPLEMLGELAADHPAGIPITWVQEEPENMGAKRWIEPQLEALFQDNRFRCITRPERESPATGSSAIHQREQNQLIRSAFSLPD
ncbi:MAG: 2-oxoglutarate dehydrogenase E1 component [Rhodothermales bacterium]